MSTKSKSVVEEIKEKDLEDKFKMLDDPSMFSNFDGKSKGKPQKDLKDYIVQPEDHTDVLDSYKEFFFTGSEPDFVKALKQKKDLLIEVSKELGLPSSKMNKNKLCNQIFAEYGINAIEPNKESKPKVKPKILNNVRESKAKLVDKVANKIGASEQELEELENLDIPDLEKLDNKLDNVETQDLSSEIADDLVSEVNSTIHEELVVDSITEAHISFAKAIENTSELQSKLTRGLVSLNTFHTEMERNKERLRDSVRRLYNSGELDVVKNYLSPMNLHLLLLGSIALKSNHGNQTNNGDGNNL